MIHLVMFDVDGTLVDSNGFDGRLYAQAVREVLDVIVDETWASYANVTDSGILEQILRLREFGRPLDELRSTVKRRFVELTRDYLERHPGDVSEVAGAQAIIETLRALPGVRVAVATGGWTETALLKLRHVGVNVQAVAIATACDGLERTQIMRLAAQRAMPGVIPSKATYFGDGAWDKRASAELGYRFIAIGRSVENDLCFDDFSDREAVLACLSAR
jgi:beta-phosphoglucomutase-like phosphatase (HAD superfamily)